MFDEMEQLQSEEKMFYVSSDITGVPYNIWITCSKAEPQNEIPQVNVEIEKHSYISICISDKPEIIETSKLLEKLDQNKLQLVRRYIKTTRIYYLLIMNKKLMIYIY